VSDERKAIADPWRQATPDSKDKPIGVGLPGSNHALDWDIQPDVSYTIRVPGAYGALTIHGAKTLVGAAIVLLNHIEHFEQLRTVLHRGGFRFDNADDVLPTGYTLRTLNSPMVLYNPFVTGADTHAVIRTGFSTLVKTLVRGSREDVTLRRLLKELGIEPLLS